MSFHQSTLSSQTLRQAKWAFTTRRVRRSDAQRLDGDVARAVAGDLVLCEVIATGQHGKIQLPSGHASELYPGQMVVLCCGARYAPDQFEAEASIDPDGCDMVAGGGIAGRMRVAHDRMRPPTQLRPLALLCSRDGRVLNVADYGLDEVSAVVRPPVVAVVGSSMNAGKTTAAASLAFGLSRAGLRVGAAKLTGTGAFGDYHALRDTGIEDVLDFTDAGHASTFTLPLAALERVAETLIGTLAERGCEAIVVELADGVLQTETAALMASARFKAVCDGVVFAAADSVGAVTGVRAVEANALNLIGLSGLLTRSPLGTAEAERATGVDAYGRDALRDPQTATDLLCRAIGSDGASDNATISGGPLPIMAGDGEPIAVAP